ncbi:Hint domain-containing protein, partial [Streptomyces sp. NPDC000229]|uniref:Hint domain-containing protein n=1 Tax=Streptomyces sp. NPDC000229 TaxID=3154247 RepID=UPI0033180603
VQDVYRHRAGSLERRACLGPLRRCDSDRQRADGSTKDIEDLKEGEYVLASDPETGDLQARKVTDTITGDGYKHLVTLTVDPDGENGKAKPSKITATANHPFWLPDYGRWAEAGELEPGMWLQTAAGTWVQITAIDDAHRSQRVHNLTVDGQHTYFVVIGSAAVLVHNDRLVSASNCPPDPDTAKQLLNDAEALHDTASAGRAAGSAGAKRADQGSTVATAILGGRKVYSVNNNQTNPAMRALAEKLGYERISGIEHIDPGIRTDAEQILMNAVDDGTLGGVGIIASSRKACGLERQNCAGRANEYFGIQLWERAGRGPW